MSNLTNRPVYQKGIKRKKKNTGDRSQWETIRALGCIICSSSKAHLHHAFTGRGGRKDDSKVLPLCYLHHQGELGIHTLGRKVWQNMFGTEQELIEKRDYMLSQQKSPT